MPPYNIAELMTGENFTSPFILYPQHFIQTFVVSISMRSFKEGPEQISDLLSELYQPLLQVHMKMFQARIEG